jgi:hypothetical protein
VSSFASTVPARRQRVTVVNDPSRITVPEWVVDLRSFRRWTGADKFPEEGRVCYLAGEVWVDMSKEQIFTHVAVKTEFTIVIGGLVKSGNLGLFLADGAYLSNVAADIGVRPDGVFVGSATLRSGRVRLVEGKDIGFVELEGSPDMVLEIVSQGSLRKDKVTLRKAYWEAGVQEYWLVDARTDPPVLDILHRTGTGYRATGRSDGWLRSAVFGQFFRLTQHTGALGHPEYTLAVTTSPPRNA